MAETSEIVAGAGVLGAAFAAFLASVGLRKPGARPPEKGDDTMAVRLAELEQRQTRLEQSHGELRNVVLVLVEQQRRAEVDREEANRVRSEIFDRLNETRQCLARIEGRLE